MGLQEVGPREGPGSVGECEIELSHSQVNSHVESWSPCKLLKLQRKIVKGKTPFLEQFFISLESYQSVDV
jgi:hypothetical protein